MPERHGTRTPETGPELRRSDKAETTLLKEQSRFAAGCVIGGRSLSQRLWCE
jgi:hypothetical protein